MFFFLPILLRRTSISFLYASHFDFAQFRQAQDRLAQGDNRRLLLPTKVGIAMTKPMILLPQSRIRMTPVRSGQAYFKGVYPEFIEGLRVTKQFINVF